MSPGQQAIVDLFRTAATSRTATTQQKRTPVATTPAVAQSSGGGGGMPALPKAPVTVAEGSPTVQKNPLDWSTYDKMMQEAMSKLRSSPDFAMSRYIPVGDPYRNINSKDHAHTLRLSRLTDAMNNQYFVSPRRLGAQVALKGGGVSNAPGLDYGDLYQMPIETEEQRQMQTMRQSEADQRAADLKRQDDAQRFALEQQKAQAVAQIDHLTGISKEQREMLKQWVTWNYDQAATRYQSELQLHVQSAMAWLTQYTIPLKAATVAAASGDPIFRQMFMSAMSMGVAPSPMEMEYLRGMANAGNRGATPEQAHQNMMGYVVDENVAAGRMFFNRIGVNFEDAIGAFKQKMGIGGASASS